MLQMLGPAKADMRHINCKATKPRMILCYTFIDWVDFAELQLVWVVYPDVLHVIWKQTEKQQDDPLGRCWESKKVAHRQGDEWTWYAICNVVDEHSMEIDTIALQSLFQYEVISQLVEEKKEGLEDECYATGSKILALDESDKGKEQRENCQPWRRQTVRRDCNNFFS